MFPFLSCMEIKVHSIVVRISIVESLLDASLIILNNNDMKKGALIILLLFLFSCDPDPGLEHYSDPYDYIFILSPPSWIIGLWEHETHYWHKWMFTENNIIEKTGWSSRWSNEWHTVMNNYNEGYLSGENTYKEMHTDNSYKVEVTTSIPQEDWEYWESYEFIKIDENTIRCVHCMPGANPDTIFCTHPNAYPPPIFIRLDSSKSYPFLTKLGGIP